MNKSQKRRSKNYILKGMIRFRRKTRFAKILFITKET